MKKALLPASLLGMCSCGAPDTGLQEVSVAWSDGNAAPMSLEGARRISFLPESLVVAVSGCASGYAVVRGADAMGVKLTLPIGDRGCVAALRSFVLEGETWRREGGGDFAGPGSAFFASSSTGKRIFVENPERLSNPVASVDRVSFRAIESLPGSGWQLLVPGQRGEIVSRNGGRAGPFLDWHSGRGTASLVGIGPAPGYSPTFRVKLRCMGEFAPRATVSASTCRSGGVAQSFGELRFLLVPDFYADGRALTRERALALFGDGAPAESGAVPVASIDDFFVEGDSGGVHVTLTSVQGLLACRKYLLLILRQGSTLSKGSVTYLNLDFASVGTVCS